VSNGITLKEDDFERERENDHFSHKETIEEDTAGPYYINS
jgi:hypothetical protein